ncbi:DUF2232 domain-containing protein [Chengkuizengella sediminis]|uniref:DUF2232 domain-containing protein n=1 Tax=Chengkuizengella sediminis TaxID=1885917 RepID=UPI00138A48FD|nr:DUF2232 domain-containing protein [Chengkuizengella sediminis]NDI36928.1 DUF2232 domain-containing protein [Chengkuizengella sediminis]
MLKYSWKSFLWSTAYILILLSLFTPLSIITFSIMLVPAIILAVTLNRKTLMIQYIISILICSFIFPTLSIGIVILSLFTLIPSIIMGDLYKKESAGVTLLIGIITLLVLFVSALFVGSLLDLNLSRAMEELVNEAMSQYPELNQITTEQTLTMLKNMLPFYLIMSSLFIVVVSHWLSRMILQKMDIQIPKMKPIKDWKLPKSLLWYYLGALLLQLFMNPEEGSYIMLITVNLIPLLTFIFSIQAISFLFYIADIKKWRFIRIIGIVLFPFLPLVFSFLGMLDIAFDIRKGFTS